MYLFKNLLAFALVAFAHLVAGYDDSCAQAALSTLATREPITTNTATKTTGLLESPRTSRSSQIFRWSDASRAHSTIQVPTPVWSRTSWPAFQNTTHAKWTSSHASRPTSDITVGAAGKLVFSPPTLRATKGTIIRFNFLGVNHTLTQSEFQSPCRANGQFDSGFKQFNPQNVSGKFIVNFEVISEEPQWFFCAQTVAKSHCHAGMVFSLNDQGAYQSFLQNALDAVTTFSPPIPPVSTCILPSFTLTGNGTMGVALPSKNASLPSLSNRIIPVIPTPLITNTGNRRKVNALGLVLGAFLF